MKRILAIALLVAGGTAVWADGDEEGEGFARAPANATYEAECGACHLAYPAGFLPAASWSAIMARTGMSADWPLGAVTCKLPKSWMVGTAVGRESLGTPSHSNHSGQ